MNILLAIAVMIIIIIASYLADRKYPTKRIFIIPCGIILLCFVAVYSSVYHKIISNYENQSISATEALSQLQRLYDETNAFNNSLQDALPPSELSQNNYTLVYNILEKTRVYSYKLNETIRQSIVIINEGTYNQIEHKDIVNNLNRIYAIEAPIMLDINSEVSQIKDNLTIPEN